jgi:cyclopropane-fatty-acyl-phospholipid synthase
MLRYPSRQLLSRIDRHLGARGVPLRVKLWTGESHATGASVNAEVAVRRPRGLLALAHPDLGTLARSYVEEDIDVSGDARSIIGLAERLCVSTASGGGRPRGLLHAFKRHRHTRAADRRAISYHYDVSNDFYRLWLDERMVYSCAYFRDDADTLNEAQRQKLDHICRKLMLRPGERFLDGCGWGALVMHAAEHYGVRALGVTVSRNQYESASAEIRRRGLQQRCEVRLRDYRDIGEAEPYDKIASVGMFEHVGIANFPVYFGKIYRLLKPGGMLMNHGITSMGVGSVGGGPDFGGFIDEYVFPDGELTHVSGVIAAMAEQGLECVDAESLRPHYAKTLWHWVSRLESRRADAIAIAGEKKYRIWRIYMAGSAWSFERGWLSVYQLLAGRPDTAARLPLPLTREHVYEGCERRRGLAHA